MPKCPSYFDCSYCPGPGGHLSKALEPKLYKVGGVNRINYLLSMYDQLGHKYSLKYLLFGAEILCTCSSAFSTLNKTKTVK